MAKVGDLVIDLRADIADFKVGMSRAQQEIQKTAAVLKREMRQQSKDAKDSIDLLSDAVGIRLPRELKKVFSELPVLRTTLAAAFPVAGAVAFVAVIADQIVPAVNGLIDLFTKVPDTVEKAMADAARRTKTLRDAMLDLKKANQEAVLSGLTGTAKAQQQLIFSLGDRDAIQGQIDVLKGLRDAFQAKTGETRSQFVVGVGPVTELTDDAKDAAAAVDELNAQIRTLEVGLEAASRRSAPIIADFQSAEKEASKAAKSIAKLTDEQKRLASGRFGVGAETGGIGRLDLSPGLAPIARGITVTDSEDIISEMTKDINRQADAVGDKLTKAWEAQQKAIEAAAASARKFGEDVGSSLKELIIHGGNARQIFLALAQDVFSFVGRKFILPGAGDGFFGSLLGGLFGGARAMGGPVLAGGSYLVGEQGPELFVPNVSGSIVPNNSMGGVSIVINQDNRGADAEAMLRARQSIEQSAATLAVQVMAARKARS